MSAAGVSQLALVAALALAIAVFLLWYAARLRAAASLRRRLGELHAPGAGLVRDDEGALRRLLAESGLGWTAGMFGARAGAAAVVGIFLGAIARSAFLAVALAGVAVALVWLLVRQARTRRLAQCDEQLPQALEIVALALRAGHALPGALRLAADEAPAPLCRELRRAVDEHALGRPIGAVVAALGDRLPGCAAVATFVVAVSVLAETGGNLVVVLERIVETARARTAYRARLRALTAEGRQSARLLALLPAAFGLAAMTTDPSYGRTLLGDGPGRVLLLVAMALWAAGLLWIRRLVRPVA